MSTKIEIPQFPELEFEEQKHIYTLRGMELPSVTKIMQPLSSFIYSRVDARTLNAAADKGTIVHNACENFIKFGIVDISAGYSGYIDAFLKWHEDYSPEILASETRLYHKVMRYAGTADMVAIVDGVLTLIDINQRTSWRRWPAASSSKPMRRHSKQTASRFRQSKSSISKKMGPTRS